MWMTRAKPARSGCSTAATLQNSAPAVPSERLVLAGTAATCACPFLLARNARTRLNAASQTRPRRPRLRPRPPRPRRQSIAAAAALAVLDRAWTCETAFALALKTPASARALLGSAGAWHRPTSPFAKAALPDRPGLARANRPMLACRSSPTPSNASKDSIGATQPRRQRLLPARSPRPQPRP